MTERAPELEVFQPSFNFSTHAIVAAETGYAFAAEAFTPAVCAAMESEVAGLDMEYGDHISKPINAGRSNEVRQSHERYYDELASGNVPVALFVAEALHRQAGKLIGIYPELSEWKLNEAGYQNYRGDSDMIGPHRDRRNDGLLAVTITINGSAGVRIHELLGAPDDYKNTRIVEEFQTEPGSAMLLRAPGLTNGEQTVHEVLPPEHGSRLILNLRMRPPVDEEGTPKILEQPSDN